MPVTVTAQYAADALDQAWLASPAEVGAGIPQPPADTNCDHLIDWIRDANLVDRGSSQVTVTIRAKQDTTITIRAIRSRLVSQQQPTDDIPVLACVPFDPYNMEPFDGTYLPHAGELDIPNAPDGFVVDEDGQLATGFRPEDASTDEWSFDLEVGQIEEAYLTGFALNCDCEWLVELELEFDGQTQTVTVGNGDQPFRTIALPRRDLGSPGDRVWCLVQGRTQLVAPDPRLCAAPTIEEEAIY